MASGDFARLRAWGEDNGEKVVVGSPTATSNKQWEISVQLTEPVMFRAHGEGTTIDDAAAPVIEQLQAVGEEFE